MKTRTMAAMIGAGILALAVSAHAGRSWYAEIVITTNGAGDPVAAGSMGNAYNSADPNQYLYCAADARVGSTSAVCVAADNFGHWFMCSTTDPDLLRSIQAVAGDAYVQFTAHQGTCTQVYVNKGSAHAPKRP